MTKFLLSSSGETTMYKPSGIIHIRHRVLVSPHIFAAPELVVSERGGATIAYDYNGYGNYEAAASFCMKTDNFNRKRGVEIAVGRLLAKRETGSCYGGASLEELKEWASYHMPHIRMEGDPVYNFANGVTTIRNDDTYEAEKAIAATYWSHIVANILVPTELDEFRYWQRGIQVTLNLDAPGKYSFDETFSAAGY